MSLGWVLVHQVGLLTFSTWLMYEESIVYFWSLSPVLNIPRRIMRPCLSPPLQADQLTEEQIAGKTSLWHTQCIRDPTDRNMHAELE